jgi:flagellar hook-associated protein 2
MANSISSLVTGVAGFDTTAAVEGMLSFQTLEISQAKSKQDAETAKQTALTTINTALSALRTTATGMADKSAFFGYTASLSSNSASVPASTLLDVSGTNSVSAGQHSIIVQQLAQAKRISSSAAVKDSTGTAASSDKTALNLSGSFQIGSTTITVSTSDSLQDIAAAINQKNTGSTATGVSASVVKVATSSDYRLTLSADATGSTGFTISGTDLDSAGTLANLQLGATGQSNAQQVVQIAKDAQISLDGLTITRSSNQISDVLSGVTLSLKQADTAVTVNMSIDVDKQALRDNVQAFVDAYNSVQTLINDQFKFDTSTQTSGILSGEGLLRTIQSSLSSNLLQSVPGLNSDRNSLVMLGIEPDSTGQLTINEDRFTPFLNATPEAVRDVFVAQGSSTNTDLQFLTNGLNTPSGTYSVNITQAATKASVTGTTDLSSGLAADETVTITETGSSRQAVVSLTSGQSQSSIITALNTEFTTAYTEQHKLSTALTVSGSPATAANTFSDLGLSVVAGDSITISGNLRSGAVVNSTFSVLEPSTDTLATLLTAIQSAFNQEVIASIDASGNIVITDSQSGDSQTTTLLTANNEGGGTLSFGSDTVVTEGRYALGMEAVISGNMVTIQSAAFGSSGGFSIAQSADGLGITDQSLSGVNVAGTINGLAATGTGQLLQGSTGNVDGLGLFYSGASTVTSDMVVQAGIAARFDGLLDLFANSATGLVQNRIISSQDTFDTLTTRIADLEARLEQQRASLTLAFTQMQQTLSSLQSSGNFITQQINAQNARR